MPPLPLKSIKVAGHTVKLKADPKLDDYGQCSGDGMVISVGTHAFDAPKDFKETVRHELAHSALSLSGISYALPDGMEEAIVRCLDNILYPALDELEAKLKKQTTA